MTLKTALQRARRGLREERRLYFVAISSLAIAFLGLGLSLVIVSNLGAATAHWRESAQMSVYLAEDANETDVARLRAALIQLDEIRDAEHVTSALARARFLEGADVDGELGGLPADAFPASLELHLAPDVPRSARRNLATRLQGFAGVEDVETYDGWFARLETFVRASRVGAIALAILVALAVFGVVGNTIRLAIARRAEEIEVLKLCGATDDFVRRPFVLEGMFQSFCASLVAVLVLVALFVAVRPELDASFVSLVGIRATFLSPFTLVAILVGGAAVGAAGSAISLRRYLSV